MKNINGQRFGEERALYNARDIKLNDCIFAGFEDGESALKEGKNIEANNCLFNLRYPCWHDDNLSIINSEMTPGCRAAIWYSNNVNIVNSKLNGIKAVRECNVVNIKDSTISSSEFGWFSKDITMEDSKAESEYFMMHSKNLHFRNVDFKGKYSFQYIEDSTFEDCIFDTKDAFWHAKNVVVKNSIVKGEYLAWYCDGVTFDHCKIIGTQPLCYCKNLKLIDCEMINTDLSFEKSEVEATITNVVDSIKNPLVGTIEVAGVKEIIMDDENAKGKIVVK